MESEEPKLPDVRCIAWLGLFVNWRWRWWRAQHQTCADLSNRAARENVPAIAALLQEILSPWIYLRWLIEAAESIQLGKSSFRLMHRDRDDRLSCRTTEELQHLVAVGGGEMCPRCDGNVLRIPAVPSLDAAADHQPRTSCGDDYCDRESHRPNYN